MDSVPLGFFWSFFHSYIVYENKILVVYFNDSFIIIEKKQKILIFFIKKSDKLSQIFKFKKSDFLSQVFLSLKKAIRIHQLIS